ncbi:hypothetical protein P4S72_06800 [Vibrio sp. PP-XX7]
MSHPGQGLANIQQQLDQIHQVAADHKLAVEQLVKETQERMGSTKLEENVVQIQDKVNQMFEEVHTHIEQEMDKINQQLQQVLPDNHG